MLPVLPLFSLCVRSFDSIVSRLFDFSMFPCSIAINIIVDVFQVSRVSNVSPRGARKKLSTGGEPNKQNKNCDRTTGRENICRMAKAATTVPKLSTTTSGRSPFLLLLILLLLLPPLLCCFCRHIKQRNAKFKFSKQNTWEVCCASRSSLIKFDYLFGRRFFRTYAICKTEIENNYLKTSKVLSGFGETKNEEYGGLDVEGWYE